MANELWFRFHPSRFMSGIRGLNANEVKVYISLLCRMYERDGPIADNDELLATYCEMRPSSYRKALDRLVRLDKIQASNGQLFNRTAGDEISYRASKSEFSRRAGKKSAEKRQENQHTESTPVERPFSHKDTEKEIRETAATARARDVFLDAVRDAAAAPETQVWGADPLLGPVVARWAQLGLDEAEILAVIRSTPKGRGCRSPNYFDGPMQDAAGRKNAPPLQPTSQQNGGRHERRSRAFEAKLAIAQRLDQRSASERDVADEGDRADVVDLSSARHGPDNRSGGFQALAECPIRPSAEGDRDGDHGTDQCAIAVASGPWRN